MDKDTSKQLSSLVEGRLPEFIRVDNPTLVAFLAAYYEWLQNKDRAGKIMSPMLLQDVIDIDTSMDEFLTQFKKEYLLEFPEQLAISKANGKPVDARKLMKNIKSFYRAKGTEKSYEFLFRILYDTAVEFYYPKTDVLRVSDGKWFERTSLKISNSLGDRIFDSVGRIIYQKDSSGKIISSAKVTDVSLYQQGQYDVAELTLSGRNGSFSPGSLGISFDIDGKTYHEIRIYGVVTSVNITNGGSGYAVGDKVTFTTASGDSGEGAMGAVSLVTSTGSIRRIRMDNFGVNYDKSPSSISIQSLGGSGFTGTTSVTPVCRGEGYYINSDGRLSSRKVIQDNHYYQDYSYVLKTEVVIDEYREAIRKLVHPAGLAMFGQVLIKRCSRENLMNSSALIRYEVPLIGHYVPYTFNTYDNLQDWFALSATGASSGVLVKYGYNPTVHDSLIKSAKSGTKPKDIGNPITNQIGFKTAESLGYTPQGLSGFQNADPFWIVYEHPNQKIRTPVIAQVWRSQLSDFVSWNEWCSVTGGAAAGWTADFYDNPSLEKKYAFVQYNDNSAFRKITARSFFEMQLGTEFDCRTEDRLKYAAPVITITKPLTGQAIRSRLVDSYPLTVRFAIRNYENLPRFRARKIRITLDKGSANEIYRDLDLNQRVLQFTNMRSGTHSITVEALTEDSQPVKTDSGTGVSDRVYFTYTYDQNTVGNQDAVTNNDISASSGLTDPIEPPLAPTYIVKIPGTSTNTGSKGDTAGSNTEVVVTGGETRGDTTTTTTTSTSDTGGVVDGSGKGSSSTDPDVIATDTQTNTNTTTSTTASDAGGETDSNTGTDGGGAFHGFDFNNDGKIDGADLGLLLAAWGTNNPKFDSNHDGKVDGADLGSFLGVWTPPASNPPFGGFDFNGDGKIDGADLGLFMGAYGTNVKRFDANGDGKVDGADLGLFLGAWAQPTLTGQSVFTGYDFNGDGKIDSADLGILLGAYGTTSGRFDANGDGKVDSADLGLFLGAFSDYRASIRFTGFDFNGDGKIDGADLGLFMAAYGTNNPKFDANGDGIVDSADLGLFLGSWSGPGTEKFTGFDFNKDGRVDGQDLGLFMTAYGTNNPKFDANGDGIVDSADLGLFLAVWKPNTNTGTVIDVGGLQTTDDGVVQDNGVVYESGGNEPFTGFDFNKDGKIDSADLGLLLGAYGSNSSKYDANGDGKIDSADLGLFLGAYASNNNKPFRSHDFNGDGKIDSADLGLLLAAYGTNNRQFDSNGDGKVDSADLGLFLTAYAEYNNTIFKSFDFNGDGKVDGVDLGIFLDAWGTNDRRFDANKDGKVDSADLGLFLGVWTPPSTTGSSSTATFKGFDFNGDGKIDGADLALLLGAYGSSDKTFDANNDGIVNSADLGLFLSAYSDYITANNSNNTFGGFDFNGDGKIDGADLGAFLAAWGTSQGKYDSNSDGKVDGADLGAFISAYAEYVLAHRDTFRGFDFNGDGKIDGADLALLLAAFGSSDPKFDSNNDGKIDGADLANFLAAFNPNTDSGTSSPGTLKVMVEHIPKTGIASIDNDYEAKFAQEGVGRYILVYGQATGTVNGQTVPVLEFHVKSGATPGYSTINKDALVSYLFEQGVVPNAATPTYVALNLDEYLWDSQVMGYAQSAEGIEADTTVNGTNNTYVTNQLKAAADYCKNIFGSGLKITTWGYPYMPFYFGGGGGQEYDPNGPWWSTTDTFKEKRIAWTVQQFKEMFKSFDWANEYMYDYLPSRALVESGKALRSTTDNPRLGVMYDLDGRGEQMDGWRLAHGESVRRIKNALNKGTEFDHIVSLSRNYVGNNIFYYETYGPLIPTEDHIDYIKKLKASNPTVTGVAFWNNSDYAVNLLPCWPTVITPSDPEWIPYTSVPSWASYFQGSVDEFNTWYGNSLYDVKKTQAYYRNSYILLFFGGVDPTNGNPYNGWTDPALKIELTKRFNDYTLDLIRQVKAIP